MCFSGFYKQNPINNMTEIDTNINNDFPQARFHAY